MLHMRAGKTLSMLIDVPFKLTKGMISTSRLVNHHNDFGEDFSSSSLEIIEGLRRA